MSLEDDFAAAQQRIKTLPSAPPPDKLLELYGLFKQSNQGDVSGKRPGMLDIRGRAKFDAWTSRKGMSQDAAKQAYVELVDSLVVG